jgi:hypothetical protein
VIYVTKMITIVALTLTLALTFLFISPLIVVIFPSLYLIVVIIGNVLSTLAIVHRRRQVLTPALTTLI